MEKSQYYKYSRELQLQQDKRIENEAVDLIAETDGDGNVVDCQKLSQMLCFEEGKRGTLDCVQLSSQAALIAEYCQIEQREITA